MKILTKQELVEIINRAFQEGYSAGAEDAEGAIHVKDAAEVIREILKELGEL